MKSLSRRLGEWVTEENVSVGGALKATGKAEVSGGIPGLLKLMVGLKSTLKTSADKKETLRTKIDQGITGFLNELNDIINHLQTQLRDQGRKGLVLIMDSLDRIIPKPSPDGRGNTHTDLFLDHADHLQAPRCHVVYTVPISIYFEQNLTTRYSMPLILPMVKIRERGGSECDSALAAMEEAVQRRMNVETLFENPADVRRLCLASGGHIRDLMHLLRTACDYSDEQISTATVDRAIQVLTNNYDRLVKDADLPNLVRVYREKRLPSDREYAMLPYHLLVLEYRNGGQWADVHPAVQRTPKFQEALEAADQQDEDDGSTRSTDG